MSIRVWQQAIQERLPRVALAQARETSPMLMLVLL
jgi:hypothetical protein